MSYHKHRDYIFRKYSRLCWVCGKHGSEIDHVIPRSLGGSDVRANLPVICSKCNKRRNRLDSAYSYDKLPNFKAIARKGSVNAYRGKVQVVPSMFKNGASRARQLKHAEARLADSPGYRSSKILVQIGICHTQAVSAWLRQGHFLAEFLDLDATWSEGLIRSVLVEDGPINGVVSDDDFLLGKARLSYQLVTAQVPSDWESFHFWRCGVCPSPSLDLDTSDQIQ